MLSLNDVLTILFISIIFFAILRIAGEEWLVTSDDTSTYIPECGEVYNCVWNKTKRFQSSSAYCVHLFTPIPSVLSCFRHTVECIFKMLKVQSSPPYYTHELMSWLCRKKSPKYYHIHLFSPGTCQKSEENSTFKRSLLCSSRSLR